MKWLNPPDRDGNTIDKLGEKRVFAIRWYHWFRQIDEVMSNGFTGTITTAPLTGGGTAGSITFVNGIVTDQQAAT